MSNHRCPACGRKMARHSYVNVNSSGVAQRIYYYRCAACGTEVESHRERVKIG